MTNLARSSSRHSSLQAIAKTITKFLVEPLEHIGHSVNKFLRAILIGLPVTISPLVLAFVMFVCLFLLMMSCGYRVRVWPLFALEPTARPATTSPANELRLQSRIDDLTQQVLPPFGLLQTDEALTLNIMIISS